MKHLREHLSAPPSDGSKQSWSQIPSGIDGVTTVEPKRGANKKHNQADHHWDHTLVCRRIVVAVQDSKNTAHKESRAKQLKIEQG